MPKPPGTQQSRRRTSQPGTPLSHSITILAVDDDRIDLTALRRFIKREELPWLVTETRTVSEARRAAEAIDFDIAILDHRLADGSSGLELIPELGDLPVIMVTGA
ncbi:MAG: response regulator, partial [Myxococcota bacterium]